MKIRNGFVSNSSSSSYVIRGIKVKKIELKTIFNMDEISDEDASAFDTEETSIMDRVSYHYRGTGLDVEDTASFFEREITDDAIIGVKICEIEDGVPTELPEPNDEEIKNLLARYGVKADKLFTFVKYISNDNF